MLKRLDEPVQQRASATMAQPVRLPAFGIHNSSGYVAPIGRGR